MWCHLKALLMMNNTRSKLKLFIRFFILFIVLVLISFSVVDIYKQQAVENELNSEVKNLQTNYNLLIYQYKSYADSIIYYINQHPDIIKLLSKASKASKAEKKELRKKLYAMFKKEFQAYKKIGVKLILFTEPNNHIFLRMHKPDRFDDDISDVRHAIVKANATKEEVFGFEQGKISHAFRHIYPLYDSNQEHIASIDISFSSEKLQRSLIDVHDLHSHFLVNKKVINARMWKVKNVTSPYSETIEHKNYMVHLTTDIVNPNIESSKHIIEENRLFIDTHIEASKPFAIYGKNDSDYTVISFLPIFSAIEQNSAEAYLVSYSPSTGIQNISRKFLYIKTLIFIIIFLILLLISLMIQKRQEVLLTSKVFSHMSDGVLITDTNQKVIRVNDAFLRMTQYSKKDLIGKQPSFLQSSSHDKAFYQKMWDDIISGGSWHGNITDKKKDGSVYIADTSISSLTNKEVITHYIVVASDITDRIEQENELKKAIELAEQASKAKSEFLANMSHEIRTPMNSIIGMTQLALDGRLENKEKNYIHKANISAQNLLGIINDILDFSKIEAGKMVLSPVHFALRDVVAHVFHLISVAAKDKDISTRIKLDQNVPKCFFADSLRLGQVLVNLAGNAVKFSDKKGNVTLSIALEEETATDAVVKFSVIDEGIGISKENQAKLFQLFSQADSSIQKKFGGTGLGLAIAQKIVGLMHGKISVESEEGKGSTFSFFIKMKKSDENNIESSSRTTEALMNSSIKKLFKAKVLLVEDNEMNQELALDLLEKNGVIVTLAENGQEALDILESGEKFDLVLMDCQMPVMDGYTATKIIREKDMFKKLPIIALTANVLAQDIERTKSVGMNDHIPKPINPTQMFNTMAEWIKK